jgi:hypothetical protein
MNKWPSRDRHRNGKNPRKPVRCVFYTKWRKTTSKLQMADLQSGQTSK